MFKRLHTLLNPPPPPPPTAEEVVVLSLEHAKLQLLEAEEKLERARADREVYANRIKRLQNVNFC